jgi:hypothetical protein
MTTAYTAFNCYGEKSSVHDDGLKLNVNIMSGLRNLEISKTMGIK